MMFTEGLDDSAISWIKQGSEVKQEPPRSPLTERVGELRVPRSPIGLNRGSYISSNILPPLKYRSNLLSPHKTVSLGLDESLEESETDDESIGSVQNDSARNYSDEDGFTCSEFEYQENLHEKCYDSDTFSSKPTTYLNPKTVSSLNKGYLMEEMKIQLPTSNMRFMDRRASQNLGTAGSCRTSGSERLYSTYTTPTSIGQKDDLEDFRTPSAPPMFDIGGMKKKSESVSELSEDTMTLEEFNRGIDDMQMPEKVSDSLYGEKEEPLHIRAHVSEDIYVQRNMRTRGVESETPSACQQSNLYSTATYCDTSGQNAWQTLVAYDACVRLCLNAWSRACPEAPEFLRDECLILRSAFGLHTFLLQPRGQCAQPAVRSDTVNKDQACSLNSKKVVGKIRVEVKKVRVKQRRELKSTYSLSAMYMQVGAEYVRQVSSLVKTHINSRRIASFAVKPEERFSCLIHLKSSIEDDAQSETTSGIRLQPGSGDCYDFFPENRNDALILEIQDTKKSFHGRAIVSVASLTDNLNDRIRWWPLYHEGDECVGKIQLSVASTITTDEAAHIKNGPIVETLAYDLLLESAMRAQHFSARNLRLDGPWKWLLNEFADYYGVSDSYTKLRFLSYIMNVGTPTKDCLELVYELLEPITKARIEKSLTRQEKSILLDCETQVENLLATVFENYKSLDENSPTGLTMGSFGLRPEIAAPAIVPAVKVYTLLHDILAQDSQAMLRNYFQTAAARRCRKHMMDTDEFISNTEGFLVDNIAISTAYLKMKNLCFNITNEIQADIKIHNQNILPSSIDLSSITASVYNIELYKRLRGFLAAWPPSRPSAHVNELLTATDDFERNLKSWNISPVQGGVDSKKLYHDYIMVWVQDMQLNLLDLCKAEKVAWSGVITNHSTSPFSEEMYEKIKQMLTEYEVVMTRWPQYSLVLENAIADVERAIVKAMEKQYSDILTPLKDSIQKRLGMQVQKLTGRQSNVPYSLPIQLGTFLNTIRRILDVLHCKVEDILRSWASNLPVIGDKKSLFGEQMNGVTVMLRTKYKNYMQATIEMLVNNTLNDLAKRKTDSEDSALLILVPYASIRMQVNRSTRLKRILEETKEADGESEVRERMQLLSSQLIDSISNLHEVFISQIFVAMCRGLWDKMGQVVLKFLEGRKENRVWYNGSYYALGILDDTCASQMQRLQGNALREEDLEPPRSIIEARSILSRDSTNANNTSSYMYF